MFAMPMLMKPNAGTPFVPPVVMGLTNPGAEAGDASGWTAASGGSLWSSINTAGSGWPPTIFEGSRYFWAGALANARMYQDVDVSTYATAIDAGSVVAEMALRFATLDSINDNLSIFLRALNSSDSVLATVAQEGISAAALSTGWLLEDLNMLLPSGTRKVRVEVHGTRVYGTDNDVHVDAIGLTLYGSSRRITPTFGASISKGNRTGSITVTATNIAAGGGSLSGLIDGSFANDYYFAAGTGNGGTIAISANDPINKIDPAGTTSQNTGLPPRYENEPQAVKWAGSNRTAFCLPNDPVNDSGNPGIIYTPQPENLGNDVWLKGDAMDTFDSCGGGKTGRPSNHKLVAGEGYVDIGEYRVVYGVDEEGRPVVDVNPKPGGKGTDEEAQAIENRMNDAIWDLYSADYFDTHSLGSLIQGVGDFYNKYNAEWNNLVRRFF